MPSLTIAWEYLTSYAVATVPSHRDRAEWPSHPARVFMALAAALFDTEPPEADDEAHSNWKPEEDAIKGLQKFGDPDLLLFWSSHSIGRSQVGRSTCKAGPKSQSGQDPGCMEAGFGRDVVAGAEESRPSQAETRPQAAPRLERAESETVLPGDPGERRYTT